MRSGSRSSCPTSSCHRPSGCRDLTKAPSRRSTRPDAVDAGGILGRDAVSAVSEVAQRRVNSETRPHQRTERPVRRQTVRWAESRLPGYERVPLRPEGAPIRRTVATTHVLDAFTSRQAAWVVRTIHRSANPRPAAGSSAAGWGCKTAGRSSALTKRASRAYNIGRWRGRGPRGNAASIRMNSSSVSRSGPALALSAACSGLDALGIVKVDGLRARNRSAT